MCEQKSPDSEVGFLSAACLTGGCEGVKGADVSRTGKYYNQSQFNTQGEGRRGLS